jgi:hypothetical protein
VAGQPRLAGAQAASTEHQTPLIPVACRCGKKLRVKAELAGKRVKCPACGQALTVPADQLAAAQSDDVLDLGALAGVEEAAATTLGAPLSHANKKGQPANTRLIVGLSGGVGAAVLVLLLVLLFWPSGEDKELAKDEATPTDQSPATGETTRATAAAGRDEQPVRSRPAENIRPRTYPSFPDALTEPPAWIGPDAPFDVAKFLEAPPPDQNAAPLYLDALFEFNSELSLCFCPTGKQPEGDVKQRAETATIRGQEMYRFEEAWKKNPASVDNAAVDAWLKGYETGFEKLAAAQQRPACVFETGIGPAALLPHIQGARAVATVVKWRTRRDLARGNFERPIQGVETVLRLNRDLRPRGGDACQVFSVSIDNICCEETVPAILTTQGVTAEHCDRLLAALVKHEAEARDPFLESTRFQYVTDRIVLHDLQHHTDHSGMFDPQHMQEDSPFACLRVLSGIYSRRLAREKYAAAIPRLARQKYAAAIPQTPEEALKHPLARGWSVDGKLISDDQYAKEVDAVNRVYKALLDLAERTNLERDRACATGTMADPLRDTTVAVYLEPHDGQQTILQPSKRAEATFRGTQCLVALRRWQFDHAQPPADLATLTRSAGMETIPTDPYTDQPLLMTTIQGQPVIYSVGPDGKDDRGLQAKWNQKSTTWQGDFAFHLPPPQ